MKSYYYWHNDDDGIWLLSKTPSWSQIDHYCKGDVALRMAIYALITGDASVIKALIKLLNSRKRWPDSLNQKTDSRNAIDYYWNWLMYKLKISPRKYKWQKRMSKDPFIILTCAIYWHQYEMIRDLKIPWCIQRPDLWHWIEYLKTGEKIHKEKYELWKCRSINFGIAFNYPGYAKHLAAWSAWIAKSDVVKSELLPFIPHWNLLCRLLCGDQTVTQKQIDEYIPHTGYLWTSTAMEEYIQPLGGSEPVYLDKEILQFVFDNKNWK